MSKEEIKEIEVVEEKEENVLTVMPGSEQALQQAVDRAEKYVTLQDKIRKMAIKLTNQNDWINQNGTPYLQWSGASKIANAFGVNYSESEFEKEKISDDIGEYIIYFCKAVLSWNGRSMTEVGTGSTRDAFFGKTSEGWKPLSEVDLTNVKKKAMTNMLNRGLKSLLGLSYTWEEIEEITQGKINKNAVPGVSYSKGSKGGNTEKKETKDLRVKIGEMLLEMAENNKDEAAQMLETLTEWTNKEGKSFPGKKSVRDLSEKSIPVVYAKVKAQYEKHFAGLNEGEKENANS